MDKAQTRREFLAKAAKAGVVVGAAGVAVMARGCTEQGGPEARPQSAAIGAAAGRRPNIVFILADDMGYGDLGCYGSPDVRTPVIDRLAAEGVRFTHHYSAGPECSPTRTALFTGRYLQRVGGMECAIGTTNVGRYDDAIRMAEAHDLGLPPDQAVLTRALKAAGYRMAVYGKWHLGYEGKFLPRRHGFEHFVGILGGHADYFHHTEITGTHTFWQDDREAHRDGHMTDIITEESVAFLRRQDGRRPFFLYVPYTAPHSPYQGPKDRSPAPVPKEQWETGTHATYVEMIEHMDAGIGKILAALREGGQADNTLVFFVSDNGANKTGSNAPLAGHKGGLYEGGIRVPCIARWPGVLPAGAVCDQVNITMDLTVSMVRAARAAAPAELPLEGVDILDHAARGAPATPRTLFWRARRGDQTWRAAREGDLKYLQRQDGTDRREWLFDLAADPAEKADLLAQRPVDADRLRALLARWEQDVRPTR